MTENTFSNNFIEIAASSSFVINKTKFSKTFVNNFYFRVENSHVSMKEIDINDAKGILMHSNSSKINISNANISSKFPCPIFILNTSEINIQHSKINGREFYKSNF